jgi:CHASE3 domain sensor protein
MSRTKDKWILAGLAAAFLVLVFVEVMLIGSAKERAKTAAWVTHTRDVLDKVNEVTSYLREAEAGRRGYVLSGQDEFLGQFTNRVGRVHQALRELRQLTKNNPRRDAYGDRLEALIFPRLLIFTNSIRERQEKGLDMPAQVKFMEQGQQAMDPIRQIVSQITTEERALLKAGQATQQKSAKGTTGFAVLVTLFGLGLFVTMFILFGRANRRRYQAEDVLQKTNLNWRNGSGSAPPSFRNPPKGPRGWPHSRGFTQPGGRSGSGKQGDCLRQSVRVPSLS